MALSGILASVPKHQTTLPVSGKKIEYRPFIVKEEKILFMASESKDEKTINSAIREVISACTGGTVDVFKLPIADMEYLFLQLRSHSVGETAIYVKLTTICSIFQSFLSSRTRYCLRHRVEGNLSLISENLAMIRTRKATRHMCVCSNR